jgi:hypothetical protein
MEAGMNNSVHILQHSALKGADGNIYYEKKRVAASRKICKGPSHVAHKVEVVELHAVWVGLCCTDGNILPIKTLRYVFNAVSYNQRVPVSIIHNQLCRTADERSKICDCSKYVV